MTYKVSKKRREQLAQMRAARALFQSDLFLMLARLVRYCRFKSRPLKMSAILHFVLVLFWQDVHIKLYQRRKQFTLRPQRHRFRFKSLQSLQWCCSRCIRDTPAT